MRESKNTRSENTAHMSLLLKNNKLTLEIKAVLSGNTSNTRGMSIMVSQFLESVADSLETPTKVISTEDLLAAIYNLNRYLNRLREENGRILGK